MRLHSKVKKNAKHMGKCVHLAYGVDNEGSRQSLNNNHATKINKFLNVFMFFFVVAVLFLLAAGVYSRIHTWRLRWDFILFQKNSTHIFASNGIPHWCWLHLFFFSYFCSFISFRTLLFFYVSLVSFKFVEREEKKTCSFFTLYNTHTHTPMMMFWCCQQ